jgi:hypothetical protein
VKLERSESVQKVLSVTRLASLERAKAVYSVSCGSGGKDCIGRHDGTVLYSRQNIGEAKLFGLFIYLFVIFKLHKFIKFLNEG